MCTIKSLHSLGTYKHKHFCRVLDIFNEMTLLNITNLSNRAFLLCIVGFYMRRYFFSHCNRFILLFSGGCFYLMISIDLFCKSLVYIRQHFTMNICLSLDLML